MFFFRVFFVWKKRIDLRAKTNMVHLKMGAPWKRRFRTWKPSFPGSMLIFGGVHLSNSPYSYFYASLPECIPYHYTLLCLSPSRGWKCFFWAGCSQGAMNIHVRDSAARKQQNSNMKESQEIIFLKPELRGFWGDSLTKPPFGVTSAEVVIICPDFLGTKKNIKCLKLSQRTNHTFQTSLICARV